MKKIINQHYYLFFVNLVLFYLVYDKSDKFDVIVLGMNVIFLSAVVLFSNSTQS
jgi:hypothetical protein